MTDTPRPTCLDLTAAELDDMQRKCGVASGGTYHPKPEMIDRVVAQARLAIKATDLLRDLVHAHDCNDMGDVIALIQEAAVMLGEMEAAS